MVCAKRRFSKTRSTRPTMRKYDYGDLIAPWRRDSIQRRLSPLPAHILTRVDRRPGNPYSPLQVLEVAGRRIIRFVVPDRL